MGHKDKGCAGPGHRFLEEQPLPAKKRKEELVMGWIQTSSNKSVHISAVDSPPPAQITKHFPDLLEDLSSLSWTLSRLPKITSFPAHENRVNLSCFFNPALLSSPEDSTWVKKKVLFMFWLQHGCPRLKQTSYCT